jgi:hypothetical protein
MAESADRLLKRFSTALRILGVLTLLCSAISPADDYVQQEFFRAHKQQRQVNVGARAAGQQQPRSHEMPLTSTVVGFTQSAHTTEHTDQNLKCASPQPHTASVTVYRGPPRAS